MDRRSFVKQAGAAGLGAAALGVTGVTSAGAEGRAEVTEPSGPVPSEPLVAYVRDIERGEVTVVSGTRETTYRDRALVKRLVAAGEKTGEKLWRLPIGPEYDANLESGIADLRQIASDEETADAVHGAQLFNDLRRSVFGKRRLLRAQYFGGAILRAQDLFQPIEKEAPARLADVEQSNLLAGQAR